MVPVLKKFISLILVDNSEKRPATGGLTPKKVVPRMPAEWMTSADDVELVIITIRERERKIKRFNYFLYPPV